jgi:predicted nucleic acid-binding protein
LALPDALIAAAAFVAGADLITRNARHYPMTDLKVVEPYVLADH